MIKKERIGQTTLGVRARGGEEDDTDEETRDRKRLVTHWH